LLSLPQVRVDHRNGTLHFGAQQLESDKIRGHISLLAKRLAKAATMIEPAAVPAAVAAQKDAALALCREHVAKEHNRLLARKQVCTRHGGRLERESGWGARSAWGSGGWDTEGVDKIGANKSHLFAVASVGVGDL
jgi:hypothetical protein